MTLRGCSSSSAPDDAITYREASWYAGWATLLLEGEVLGDGKGEVR